MNKGPAVIATYANSHKLKDMKVFFWLFAIISWHSSFAADQKSSNTPTYKVSVDAKVMSQFIDRGLAMSDGNPAMNVSFLYNLGPQFRLGFWGSNISNISYADDNFWFKFIADIKVDFSGTASMSLYINDGHYYKSDVRNGQSIGVRWIWNAYTGEFEWMNNYQGTKTSAEYFNLGRLWPVYMLKAGFKVGYTMQSSENYQNYFDLKGLVTYYFSSNSTIEGGATMVSSDSQFNGRGKPAFYLSTSLSY